MWLVYYGKIPLEEFDEVFGGEVLASLSALSRFYTWHDKEGARENSQHHWYLRERWALHISLLSGHNGFGASHHTWPKNLSHLMFR